MERSTKIKSILGINGNTVKPVHTGMPWGQTFLPVWTGSGLKRVFAFGEEQTTIT